MYGATVTENSANAAASANSPTIGTYTESTGATPLRRWSRSDRRGQAGEDGDGAVEPVAVPAVGEIAHQPQCPGHQRRPLEPVGGREPDQVRPGQQGQEAHAQPVVAPVLLAQPGRVPPQHGLAREAPRRGQP